MNTRMAGWQPRELACCPGHDGHYQWTSQKRRRRTRSRERVELYKLVVEATTGE